MYTALLVPVSFEEDRNSAGALQVAKALCAPGGLITLLHVMEQVPTYATEFLPDNFRDKQKAEIETALQSRTEGLDRAEVRVVDGHSGRTIVEQAKALGVDCIVVASHRPGMQDLLLGSTATHVVRHASCAVHVLR